MECAEDDVGRLVTAVATLQAALDRADRETAAVLDAGTVEDLHLLQLLIGDGPLRVGELAARGASSTTTASGRVSRLEKKGLVERRRIPGDLRAMVVALTDAGAELATRSRERRRRRLESVAPGFPFDALDDLIEAMTHHIDEEKTR